MERITQNSDLMEKLMSVETVEDLNRVLDEHGVALEAGITAKQFLDTMNSDDNIELDEENLEAVAGEVIITPTIIAAATVLGLSVAAYIKYVKAKTSK